jgi:hypothetical protein
MTLTMLARDGNGQSKYVAVTKGDGTQVNPYFLQTVSPIDYPIGPTIINVTTTNIVVLAINLDRRGAMIQNRGTNAVDLFFGQTGNYGDGFELVPGQKYEINLSNLHCEQITATAASGTVKLVVIEGV